MTMCFESLSEKKIPFQKTSTILIEFFSASKQNDHFTNLLVIKFTPTDLNQAMEVKRRQ
jgi:hypothetical protein